MRSNAIQVPPVLQATAVVLALGVQLDADQMASTGPAMQPQKQDTHRWQVYEEEK